MRRLLASNASKLRVVRHQYPRMSCPKEPNPYSCAFTRAALCAGDQGRFWEADSWLFEHAPGKPKLDLDAAVRDLSLDDAKFRGCFDSPETLARADAASSAAKKARVIDTPTYFIDGKRYAAQEAFAELRSRL
jgi:protein-disulfide isomerase